MFSVQTTFIVWLIGKMETALSEDTRICLAADDSPTKRYGPKIEGAGWHHDPTSPNMKATTCDGHSWVVLSLIVEHPSWGTISLPLLHRLYIRKEDLKKIVTRKPPEFKTKLELLIEMVQKVSPTLKMIGKPIQILFDRGYVSEEVFGAVLKTSMEDTLLLGKIRILRHLIERCQRKNRVLRTAQ